jgi:hypothetical protein
MEYFLTEYIIVCSLSLIVVIDSSHKDSYLVSLIWNSLTFAEIMAALKSIQGSTIFATATKFKKMMSDFNFNQIPSEIKYFIPGKETVNDIPNLFGWWSTIVFLVWSVCLFMFKNFFFSDFRSNSICFCNSMEYFLTEYIIVCSL